MFKMTCREFNHNTGAAKRVAMREPVIITEKGEPAYVLLCYADYVSQVNKSSILDDLACPETADIDFDPDPACP